LFYFDFVLQFVLLFLSPTGEFVTERSAELRLLIDGELIQHERMTVHKMEWWRQTKVQIPQRRPVITNEQTFVITQVRDIFKQLWVLQSQHI